MNNDFRGAICLSLATSIWGSMYVVSKYVLEFIPPFTLLWLRYAIAALLLSIFMVTARQHKIRGKDLGLLVWIGFIGYFISVGMQFLGTKFSDAHTGALITASAPVFTFIFARLLLQESITLRKILSLLLSLLGVIIIIGYNGHTDTIQTGILFLVIAAVTWAIFSVYVKKASASYSSLTITTYALLFAMVFTTPAAVWEMNSQPFLFQANPLIWLGTIYIGVVSTAGAFFLWNKGMDLLDAGVGSLFLCFQPVVGSILGWLLLNENLDLRFFIGAALIMAGLIIVSVPHQGRLRLTRS